MSFSRVLLVCVAGVVMASGQVSAECKLEVDGGADLVSRYVWRGLDFGDAPAVQPWLDFSLGGLTVGLWASYASANTTPTTTDRSFAELDAYISYTHRLSNNMAITAVVTDYYFPNDGGRYFNYDNYDSEGGPGAHTIEIGLGVEGPESLPISIFGFANVHNDEGNNLYFQLNYTTAVKGAGLDFFIGVAPGSEDTPDYYGTDDLEVINLGVTVSKELKLTEHYHLPLFVSYTLNPQAEQAYLLFGLSL